MFLLQKSLLGWPSNLGFPWFGVPLPLLCFQSTQEQTQAIQLSRT